VKHRLPTAIGVLLALLALAGGAFAVWQSCRIYRGETLLASLDDTLGRGRYDDALAMLEHVRSLTPDDPRWAIGAGRTMLLMGVFRRRPDLSSDAIGRYQKAIGLNPPDAANYSGLGWACMINGRYAAADGAFQRALQRDPYNVYYLYSLGRLREKAGRPRAAAALYRRALGIGADPRIAAALRLLEEQP